MAKLQYSKPMFSIQQIPLAGAAGTAGGCRTILIEDGSANPQGCEFRDEELGITIYADGVCEFAPQDGHLCYMVPTADGNIYNS